MKHFKYILLLLPLLYYSCTDDILQDLDTVAAQNEEQDARLDSLLTIITDQQEYIDSLNNIQHIADSLQLVYIDSLIHEGEIADSLVQLYTDSLNTTQQAYIDSLINLGNVSDSLLQVYTDSLIAVQNTLNTTQQALIDSANAEIVELTALLESIILTESSTGPTGSVSISLSSGNSLEGTLTITASSDAVLMMVSENFFIDAVWEPVATSKAFTFSSSNNFKTVYIKFTDASGLEGSAYKESYTNIAYPYYGYTGENILREGTISIDPTETYSVHAMIQGDASLEVHFPYHYETFLWWYSPGGAIGWEIGSLTDEAWDGVNTYTTHPTNSEFEVGIYDFHFNFDSNQTNGNGTIKIFENGATTPTRIVQLTW